MIHDVKRAYIPTVEWRESKRIIQEAVATVPALPDHPYVVSVPVSRSVVHRKVWAYFWSASATHSSEVDLVAFLDGKEIYRQPLQRWANSGTNRWYSGIAAIGTTYTGIGEQRFGLVSSKKH